MPNRNRLILYTLAILILSFALACNASETPEPASDETTTTEEETTATGGDTASTADEEASTIDEAAVEEETEATAEEAPAEESAETMTEEADPAETETDAETEEAGEAEASADNNNNEEAEEANEESEEELAPLAEDQIFVLPGGDPPTMDPHLSGDATSAEYVVEVYSGLMAYDNDLNLIPDVAESYEISEDGLTYTFTLREEAQFQDGQPIRADDFKWSFERACDPATGSRTADTYLGDVIGCRDKLQGDADEIEGVRVIDDLTLEVTIDEPKSFFLAKMTYPTAYVLDQENVEAGGATWFEQPNGSGPFMLTEFAPEEGVIILDKNENFYRDPQPILERVIYLINAPVDLMSGYQEGLGPLGLEDVTFDTIPVSTSNLSVATDPNNPLSEEYRSTPELSVSYLGFNVDVPPFDDPKVRQAFNLALDKERMVKLVFRDLFQPANGIVPPTMPGYENPDLSDFEFDPEQALELIAESSYEDVTELPEITLNVSGTGGGVGPLVEAIVESYEANLGITINVEQADWPDFLADLSSEPMPYQMYQLGWVADYPDPQNFLEVLFHSDSAQNYGNYSNEEVDSILDEARQVQDAGARERLYQQAEQLILEDAAWVPLYFSVEPALVKPYVQNYTIPPIKIPKLQYISIAEHSP